MTKLIVTLLVCTLLAGGALFVGGHNVAPAVGTKSASINTSVIGASVDAATGTVTATTP